VYPSVFRGNSSCIFCDRQERAVFITFEGIEASGKSLQIAFCLEYLVKKRVPCLSTREPGGTAFGAAVRRILLDTGGPPRDPVSELLLYLADRCQHLNEVIEPALRNGVTVLSDRYHDATRAYQGAAGASPRRSSMPRVLESVSRTAQSCWIWIPNWDSSVPAGETRRPTQPEPKGDSRLRRWLFTTMFA
jgi:hypothetical protein